MHIDLGDPADRMDRLLKELEAFAASHALPDAVVQDVHLALDEIVSNIVRHGCPPGRRCRITVDLLSGDRTLTVHVKDDAAPFDPLQREDPDVTAPLRDRPIGGLGIFLVKKLMTDVQYRHEDGMNHLVLTKTW